jgi:hypothetical protein
VVLETGCIRRPLNHTSTVPGQGETATLVERHGGCRHALSLFSVALFGSVSRAASRLNIVLSQSRQASLATAKTPASDLCAVQVGSGDLGHVVSVRLHVDACFLFLMCDVLCDWPVVQLTCRCSKFSGLHQPRCLP